MLLPFHSGLFVTNHFDGEMSILADRHYSRRTVGARQFCYSGRKLVLRDSSARVLFVWMFPDPQYRMDSQRGYYCSIFRNESQRKASEIVLEAEKFAVSKWGPNRAYTFIDPSKTKPIMVRGQRIVGFCFVKAGWRECGWTKSRKLILEKNLI